MSIDDMTPRAAYEEGYRNGESSLLADVNTLCDQLNIPIGDRHEFDAIRAEIAAMRRALYVALLAPPYDDDSDSVEERIANARAELAAE